MRRLLKRGVYFKLTVTTTDKMQIKVHILCQSGDKSKFIVLYQCGKIKQDTIRKLILSKQPRC